MPNLILVFNHTLTKMQEDDAVLHLGAKKIISPPRVIRDLWEQIPADAEEITPLLKPVYTWLQGEADEGDFILVQGDFGACFTLVKFCFEHQFIPVYATTSRQAVEQHLDDGSVEVMHVFKHVRFRRYGQ